MAKFLNKKENVIDFQLTPLGREKLAGGRFKPVFYQFFDDGILYDSEYAGFSEHQNEIHDRIKNETQFLEGILSFADIESFSTVGTYDVAIGTSRFGADATDLALSPLDRGEVPPRTDKFSYGVGISDVIFDSENISYAPATKIVACQGEIKQIKKIDSTDYDTNFVESDLDLTKQDVTAREYNIPQIDIALYYTKQITPVNSVLDSDNLQEVISQTSPFVDNNVIKLIKNDMLIYAEEVNTELLTENFEIEVFEIIDDTEVQKLDRKYFRNVNEQIVEGFMKTENEIKNISENYDKKAVEYYFDVLTDDKINAKIACACATSFNKDSYYVDLDHECDEITELEEIYFDIYGSVTVPEICSTQEQTQTNLYDNQLNPDLEQKDSIESCED